MLKYVKSVIYSSWWYQASIVVADALVPVWYFGICNPMETKPGIILCMRPANESHLSLAGHIHKIIPAEGKHNSGSRASENIEKRGALNTNIYLHLIALHQTDMTVS